MTADPFAGAQNPAYDDPAPTFAGNRAQNGIGIGAFERVESMWCVWRIGNAFRIGCSAGCCAAASREPTRGRTLSAGILARAPAPSVQLSAHGLGLDTGFILKDPSGMSLARFFSLPECWRFCIVVLCGCLWIPEAVEAGEGGASGKAEWMEFIDRRVERWRPQAEERLLDEVAWVRDIRTAMTLAKEHGRPVFLFTLDGRMETGRQ